MVFDYITGDASVYGVIGDPISHTFSPVIHNTIAKEEGRSIAYVPFHVKAENLGDAIKGAYGLGVSGLNVTIPHKREVMKYLVSVDEDADRIGAVNTLKITGEGYRGYNTDVSGIRRAFKENKMSLKDKAVALLGAGGSAAACAAAVCKEGVSKLYILNRTMKNAESIAENLKKYYNIPIIVLSYEKYDEIDEMYLAIQTTSLGFSDNVHKSPMTDTAFFDMAEFYLDVIYAPWKTLFLNLAASRGKKTVNGFDMLMYQAVNAYEIWFDTRLGDKIYRIKEELSNCLKAKKE